MKMSSFPIRMMAILTWSAVETTGQRFGLQTSVPGWRSDPAPAAQLQIGVEHGAVELRERLVEHDHALPPECRDLPLRAVAMLTRRERDGGILPVLRAELGQLPDFVRVRRCDDRLMPR